MRSSAGQSQVSSGNDRTGTRGDDTSIFSDAFTILVVESERACRELIVKMLNALGYRAVEAGDGIEALDRIHRQPAPDLMILAADLPRMNGADTVSAVRNLSSPKRNLPIAAISVDVPQDQIALLNETGVDLFLSRPFDMHELAQVAAELLDGHLEEVSGIELRRSFGVRN